MSKLTFPRFKLHSSWPTGRRAFIYHQRPLSLQWDGNVVSRSLAAIGWGPCVKKVAGDICFPEKREKNGRGDPPHQCERRRQRQTSAQSWGSHWLAVCTKSNSNHFTHNTPTNPKGVHAASSCITPPLPQRIQTWSRRSTFNFYPHCCSASEDGCFCSCFCFWLVLWIVIDQDDVDPYSLIISPGENQADKELSSRQ